MSAPQRRFTAEEAQLRWGFPANVVTKFLAHFAKRGLVRDHHDGSYSVTKLGAKLHGLLSTADDREAAAS